MKAALATLALLGILANAPGEAAQSSDLERLEQLANSGDKSAARALAEAFYVGRGGIAQDFARAAHWYRTLAVQGDASAQTTLGLMYARGLGLDRNMTEARKWWSLAAAQNDPGAQHNLGMVYLEGQGIAPDAAQALQWFERAATRGHVLAQRILGLMHFEGRGTERDELVGLTWLTIAAKNGEQGAEETLRLLSARVDADVLATATTRAQEWLRTRGGRR